PTPTPKPGTGDQTDTKNPKGPTTTPKTDEQGKTNPTPKFVDLTNTTKGQDKTGTTAETGKNTKQTAAAKTMPQAGEAQSPLAVLGLAILSMLGLAGFVSRKKRV
ncbi:hypothetical protein PZ01_13230, partial [Lacticaseibacillus rhamnosus]